MKAPDLLDLALRNLKESVLRNSLTTMGITVGVASLVAMLSLGVGLQQMANRRLAKSGLFDTVVVTSRRDFRSFDRGDRQNSATAAESRALDEQTRAECEKLPNVLEATPDIRFITELRYQDKPHLTMVSGVAWSARNNDAFDNMQGRFFSSDTADEVILQKEFADELVTGREQPDSKSEVRPEQLQDLIGKEISLRYGERSMPEAANGVGNSASEESQPAASGGDPTALSSFSVIRRSRQLRIVGITDHDPEGIRGSARGRVFVPLTLLQSLKVMLPSELRENTRSFSNRQTYLTI